MTNLINYLNKNFALGYTYSSALVDGSPNFQCKELENSPEIFHFVEVEIAICANYAHSQNQDVGRALVDNTSIN